MVKPIDDFDITSKAVGIDPEGKALRILGGVKFNPPDRQEDIGSYTQHAGYQENPGQSRNCQMFFHFNPFKWKGYKCAIPSFVPFPG
jgi:hypothetical protein